MDSLTITLPEPLRRHAEERAVAAGFGSAGDFICDLIERDRASSAQLESLLLEALDAEGDPIEVDDVWWAERHAELERRRAGRKPS